jgi:hypothetical protein
MIHLQNYQTHVDVTWYWGWTQVVSSKFLVHYYAIKEKCILFSDDPHLQLSLSVSTGDIKLCVEKLPHHGSRG